MNVGDVAVAGYHMLVIWLLKLVVVVVDKQAGELNKVCIGFTVQCTVQCTVCSVQCALPAASVCNGLWFSQWSGLGGGA